MRSNERIGKLKLKILRARLPATKYFLEVCDSNYFVENFLELDRETKDHYKYKLKPMKTYFYKESVIYLFVNFTDGSGSGSSGSGS